MFFLLFLSSTIIVSFQMHCFCSNMLKISFTNEFNFDVWENEQKEKSKKYWLKLFSSSDTCREFLEKWDTDLKYIWNCTVHTSRCIVCTVPFNRVRTHGPSCRVRYPGYNYPNVPEVKFQICVMRHFNFFLF